MKNANVLLCVCIMVSMHAYSQDTSKNRQNDRLLYRDDRAVQNSLNPVNRIRIGDVQHTLFIIDDKIYDSQSKELHQVNWRSLEIVREIIDTASSTPFKRILLYKKKKQ